jgi:hypothetical protein
MCQCLVHHAQGLYLTLYMLYVYMYTETVIAGIYVHTPGCQKLVDPPSHKSSRSHGIGAFSTSYPRSTLLR